MKKRHHEEEAEKDSSERWLLTYSDLITLLLALFIIMYTISTVDLVKLQQLSENLNEAFNGEKSSSVQVDSTETTGDAPTNPSSGELDEIYKELKEYVEANNLEDKVNLENTDTYIKVSLKDMFLFVPDSSVMLDQSKPVLAKIETVLNKLYLKIDHITISGHTADPANDKNKSSAMAWQLSTERAVTVLNYLAAKGLPQYKLSIAGYSHFDPVATNATEEGRAQNRRVEITIFKTNPNPTSTDTTAKSTTSTKTNNTGLNTGEKTKE